MIVPSNRLVAFAAAVWLAAALAAAMNPGMTLPAIACAVSVVCFALFDASAGLRRTDLVSVTLPERVYFSKDRPGAISVQLEFARPLRSRMRAGIAFPPEIKAAETIELRLSGAGLSARHDWPCVPSERGRYLIEAIHIELPSPAGLWAVRATKRVRAELRVYPNLLHERRKMAGLFMNREDAGIHAQRQVGKGREFEQLREYLPGDLYEDIHWKATARRGSPVTKTYQVERTQEVYVILDASRLSARSAPADGERIENQFERFLSAALLLGLVAERQGDLYGVLTFSDHVHSFVRAKRGKAHYNVCRDAVNLLRPRGVNPDFEEMASFLSTRLRRRALLLFLTNLDDPILAESFVKNVELLNRQHLIYANIITLPSVRPLFSDDSATSVPALYGQLSGHLQWQSLREVQHSLRLRGVTLSLVESSALCAELIAQYVSVKQRQLL